MNSGSDKWGKVMFDNIVASTVYLYDDVMFSTLIPVLRRTYSADEVFLLEHIPEQSSDLFTVMAGGKIIDVEMDREKGFLITLNEIHHTEKNIHLSRKSRVRAKFITHEEKNLVDALRDHLTRKPQLRDKI